MSSAKGPAFMQTSAGMMVAQDTLEKGTRLGAWEVESTIASGGMGQVYRARRADGVYKQLVALKLIHDRDAQRVDRFAAERQRLAEMDHPGIARIIDGGTHDDGRPWMTMELVDGAPILPHAAALPRRRRLELFVSLCAAVAHAHGRLVLHRDIKTANVLLDSQGQPRLIDFGISTLNEAGAAQGGTYTPATAAPEQLLGVTPTVATDIFALGILLHQLLTNELPARLSDHAVIPDTVAIADADLAAIIARATDRAPSQRYASVDGLADDVQAALSNRPVAARAGGTVYRISRFVRRFPAASGLTAAFIAALVGGILVSVNYANTAEAETKKALAELERAEFQLERTNGYSWGMAAANDLLQRSFINDGGAHRTTLLARWQAVMEARETSPDLAAGMSFALGRVFADRNDFATAAQVLEAWLGEAFGPPILVESGRQMLAGMLPRLGRDMEAIPLLRQIELDFANGPGADTFDRVSSVVKIGQSSMDPDDIAHGENVARTYLAAHPDDGPFVRFFINHQLSQLAQRRGDFNAAYDYQRAAVRIAMAGPAVSAQGRHIVMMALSDLELFVRGDDEAAARLAHQVIAESVEIGTSPDTARAVAILGLIAGRAGDKKSSVQQLTKAFRQIGTITGPLSEDYVRIGASLAEALADTAQIKAARALLDQITSEIGAQPPNGMRAVRLALARAHVDRAAGRPLQADRLPARTIAAYPYLAARHARLVSDESRQHAVTAAAGKAAD